MATRIAPALLVVLAAACGSKPTPATTTPTDPSAGGEPQPTCEPGRCLEDISRLIGERRPEARACYEEGAKRQPGLQGLLVINFAIDAEGVIAEVSQGMQDEQITEPGVVECVSAIIKSVRFAPSPKGKTTRAYHRFEFNPK